MRENRPPDRTTRSLLERVEQCLVDALLPEMQEASLDTIAQQIADFARSLIKQHSESIDGHLSRQLSAAELSAEHLEKVCAMASHLELRSVSDGEEALSVLREHGFEVREFASTTFVPHDPRLREAPADWLFQKIQTGALPQQASESANVVMICEVRSKPDVANDECWIQQPYDNDPFREELTALHAQLDGYKPEKRVDPTSRAGFTFEELEHHVLPALSKKAGVVLKCMPVLYACILANDHPAMSDGRSTEWRGETMGEAHALISGRSDRGPIRYVYYDAKKDPYANRGFRLCAVLSAASPGSDNSS